MTVERLDIWGVFIPLTNPPPHCHLHPWMKQCKSMCFCEGHKPMTILNCPLGMNN